MPAKLIKSASAFGATTLLSRITGLLRDVVFANLLGDSKAADVFFVAFRIPNFFRRLSGEGAFAAAFVPVFTDFREHKTPAEQDGFLQLLLGRFGLMLFALSAIGVAAAPMLVTVIAPGFLAQPEKYQLAVAATRITFPYIFFISLVALAAAMLNTVGRFAAPAATPVLLNLCLIGAALLIVPQFQFENAPLALAIGVIIAGVLQLLFQLPFLRQQKLTVRPRIKRKPGDDIAAAGVMQVFKLTVPALFGVSVAQINVLINTLLASFLVTGSISWLYYSDRLMEFPVGVFGIALATVILPSLSRKRAAGSETEFSDTLDWALRWVFLICIPASVGLIVLASPLIATIYFHGGFTENGVHQAAASLVAFAVGLTAIVAVKILAPGFYARKDTKTPVRIAVIAMSANILFCLLLIYPLRHVGLALATSLAAVLNAALLFIALKKENVYRPCAGWFGFLVRVFVAAAVMGIIIWFGGGDIAEWLRLPIWRRVLLLSLWVTAGALIYFVALRVLGVKLKSLWRARAGE